MSILDQGCHVTAFDSQPLQLSGIDAERFSRLQLVNGDLADEKSVISGFSKAQERFGPANILVVNSATEDLTKECPIWELDLEDWKKSYQNNAQGSFLAIKYFLRSIHESQQLLGAQLSTLAIVVADSEAGTGQTGVNHGLLHNVREDIRQLNPDGRINVVAPGIMDNEQGPAPADVARTMAFLASKRAAGHISGQCIRVERSNQNSTSNTTQLIRTVSKKDTGESIPRSLSKPKRNKIRVAVSIDLDAVSGWLGTSKYSYGQDHSSRALTLSCASRLSPRQCSGRLLGWILRRPSRCPSTSSHVEEAESL